MKLKLLFTGIVIVGVVAALMSARSRNLDETEYKTKRTMLVIRNIGHKLLLQVGDSSSRILPVKKIREGLFQLEFQSSFSFMPDSLVSNVEKNISGSGISSNYMVNVYDCASKEVVYGFEIAPLRNKIIPCGGRVQPVSCYTIQIAFADFNGTGTLLQGYGYVIALIGFCLVAFIGSNFLKGSLQKKEKERDAIEQAYDIKIGSYCFDPLKHALKSRSATIELSGKESKLLGILAARQNELIARDRLLKEVWEDEGVFTGRSLDMFISKLRKKLSGDPSVHIVSVHGKGYKLEVSQGT